MNRQNIASAAGAMKEKSSQTVKAVRILLARARKEGVRTYDSAGKGATNSLACRQTFDTGSRRLFVCVATTDNAKASYVNLERPAEVLVGFYLQ